MVKLFTVISSWVQSPGLTNQHIYYIFRRSDSKYQNSNCIFESYPRASRWAATALFMPGGPHLRICKIINFSRKEGVKLNSWERKFNWFGLLELYKMFWGWILHTSESGVLVYEIIQQKRSPEICGKLPEYLRLVQDSVFESFPWKHAQSHHPMLQEAAKYIS